MKYIAAVVFALASGPVFAELSGSTTTWELESVVDEFTDERKVFAIIAAEGGLDKGFIHVGCFPAGLEVKVGAGAYIGDKSVHNNVRYRVDQGEPVTTTMKPTSKSYVYFNDKNSPFLQQLLAGKEKVVVQLTSYDYDTSRATYSLNGAATAIGAVLEACKNK